jgi:iron complex outermembrane receptor protein
MGVDAYRAEPWETDAEFQARGVFAEGTWHAAERRRLVAGARADRVDVRDRRATAGMMGMPNQTAGQTRRQTLPGGFVRVERDVAAVPVTWYAGVGHTERMPDYWELFSADMGPMGAPNAFAGLAPEKTTQLDIGLQYRSTRLDAWVSAYAGRIDDYILFSYAPGGMMGMMSSVANVDARVRGAEAGIELRTQAGWKLGGTLAHAWGENRDSGGALPQMPPLEARLTAAYEGTRWSAGVLLRAVALQDRVAVDQGNVVGRDLGPSAGFATLALNGGYRFSDRVRLTAGIDNVLDHAYAEHLNLSGSADFGYPADPVRINEPGRTAWMKVQLSY